ncbi:unnamed protein product [Caenorhabditis auriculariae]|uniref:Glycosyltransferase family 92 protein n=1 Tax=Caenorhabditis auriculariae TaxID=2777116 RepID=A0A8S1HN51_9PELO|nr:unnamed protein product [Caenorhabditis auriculariae]
MAKSEISPELPENLRLTAEYPKTQLLEQHYGRPSLALATRKTNKRKHNVVSCVEPLLNEDSLRVFKTIFTLTSLGSFVHLPIIQIRPELFSIIRTFEKRKLVRFEPQVPLKLDQSELRAIISQIDCMLLYRETADFIVYANFDEMFYPHTENDYNNEFILSFLQAPSATQLFYNVLPIVPTFENDIDSNAIEELDNTRFNFTEHSRTLVLNVENMRRSELQLEKLRIPLQNHENTECQVTKCMTSRGRNERLHSPYGYNFHQIVDQKLSLVLK